MKKIVFLVLLLAPFFACRAIELSYVAGVSRIGIRPGSFQPLYGFGIGGRVHKFIAIETTLFYSQRTIENTTQADYFTFMAMPELGYFGKKAAVYYAPGIALNPCLHHSNIENHTYASFPQFIGGIINIKPSIMAEARLGYDIGLTGAYFSNGSYQRYSGPVAQVALRFRMR